MLTSVGVTKDALSKQGSTNLDSIVNIAIALDLKNTSDIWFVPFSLFIPFYNFLSFSNAIRDLDIEERSISRTQRKLDRDIKTMQRKHIHSNRINAEAVKLLATLEEAEGIDNEILKEWSHNQPILERKRQDYSEKLDILESNLPENVDDYRYDAIKELEQQLQQKLTELETKQNELQSYKDLPPDLTLATLMIEEKKNEAVYSSPLSYL